MWVQCRLFKKWGLVQGEQKPFEQWILEHPIASGPYVIERVDLGKTIRFRRQQEYWADQVPSRKGQFNFDLISFRYYKDEFARIEAYKAGEFDFVHENAAKNWARGYIGQKFSNGSLLKTELPNSNAQGMQRFTSTSVGRYLQMFGSARPLDWQWTMSG